MNRNVINTRESKLHQLAFPIRFEVLSTSFIRKMEGKPQGT